MTTSLPADPQGPSVSGAEAPVSRFERLVVVGAGFAGVCAAAAARERGIDALILDRADQVGGAWARMPPEMRCISPRFRDRLPDGSTAEGITEHATAPQVRDAIQEFAERRRFRVELGVAVMGVEREASELVLRTTAGEVRTRGLVVASGEYGAPRIPAGFPAQFLGEVQHSASFRASELRPHERVVVIGAGNSGSEVALAALDHGAQVTVCAALPISRPRQLPEHGLLGDLKWLGSGVPVRWVPRRAGCRARVPLARRSLWDAAAAGRIRVVGRALALESRVVRVEPGEVIGADRVVLATGFRRDVEWIGDAVELDADGLPRHQVGLSIDLPGVGFVGLPCMRTRRSGFLRGFADDARAVVARLLAQ